MDALPFGLIVAGVTGLLGSSFFMLIQLQKAIADGGLADARDMWTWPLLMVRCIVGVGAALILYFFFESGLLEGSLWPSLEDVNFTRVKENADLPFAGRTRVVPNADFALLVVWSFLAGYSQTFVPSLLLSTESRNQTGG